MVIKLPKDKRFLIGFRFPELIPFEMNDVSLVTFLPQLFRLAILEGRSSSRLSEDDASIPASVRALNEHPRAEGFRTSSSERMLSRLVQSTLIETRRKQSSKVIQIDGLVPYTLATFKPGFPANDVGFRQVDRLLYQMLLDQKQMTQETLHEFIVSTFGDGVRVEGWPTPTAERLPGEQPELDMLSELSLAYIDGLKASKPRNSNSKPYVPARPLPGYQKAFGQDVFRYLYCYGPRVPRTHLAEQLVGLVGLELTVMTVKLMVAIPALRKNPSELPPAMTDGGSSPPEIYVDCTGDPRHLSRAMAVACVRRDLSGLERFSRAVFEMRYLHTIVESLRREREFWIIVDRYLGNAGPLDTPHHMQQLLLLAADDEFEREIRREARGHLRDILDANDARGEEDEDDDARPESDAQRLVRRLEEEELSPIAQVQELLVQAQTTKAQSNTMGWLRDVGGADQLYGLVRGGANRRTWVYSPTNELWTVLVQLCAIDYSEWNPAKDETAPCEFQVSEFLAWLEARFGIIVDRPPAELGFDGPEFYYAARENLDALLRRLRLMGMFADRSDDFSVRSITPPFMELPADALAAV